MHKLKPDEGYGELIKVTFSDEIRVCHGPQDPLNASMSVFTLETKERKKIIETEMEKWLGKMSTLLAIALTPLVFALLFTAKIEYDPYGHVSGWWLLAHLIALFGIGFFMLREKIFAQALAGLALYLVAEETGMIPAKFLWQHLGTYGALLGTGLMIPPILIGAITCHIEDTAPH